MTILRCRKAWWWLLAATLLTFGPLPTAAVHSDAPTASSEGVRDAKTIGEITQESLPASQREPIPYIAPDALPFADRYPSLFMGLEGIASDAHDEPVPSKTLRTPEPIEPPPLSELRVVLDWYLSPHHATLLVARERGYYDRHGLEVTLNLPADPSLPPKLLAASQADLVVGRQTQLHMLVDEGLPLIRVATLMATPLASLVVAADSDIDTLAKLSGKTIGYSLDDSLAPVLTSMLMQHDISLDDLTLEHVNFGLGQALIEQRVDAVIGPLRHILPHQLAEEGLLTRSFPAEEHGMPRSDDLILIANRHALTTQRDKIRRLLFALEDATEWIVNYPDDAWELLVNAEPGLNTAANRRAWPDTLRRLALRPSALDAHRYDALQTHLHEHGYIEERHAIERLAIDLNAL